MYCDGAVQSWHFHSQVAHVDGYVELVCKPPVENGIVWVVEIYYVEGHVLCSCIFFTSEGNW